eukprot:GEMP01038590.1.p1 GENE.GEMP01038590.1~~GEMP01038590.1.p1  ORF type:complete len:175 (+),score=32.47 GEMP01038590.1:61-585(+)
MDLLTASASKGLASLRRSMPGKRPSRRLSNGFWTIPGYKTIYRVITEGEKGGPVVKNGTNVTVHARGSVEGEDKAFWSTRDEDEQPFSYRAGAGDMIPGWEKGLIGMQRGEKRELIIPSSDAYGKEGYEMWGIPPKATLVFELELLTVEDVSKSRPVGDFAGESDSEDQGDAFL